MMPDQPPDDNANEIHQTVLALAGEFRANIPPTYRDRALYMLICEIQGEEENNPCLLTTTGLARSEMLLGSR